MTRRFFPEGEKLSDRKGGKKFELIKNEFVGSFERTLLDLCQSDYLLVEKEKWLGAFP
jgi:hypothetical protein